MTSWEYNLINKYHPKYNIILNNANINIKIQEPEWIFYKTNNNILENKKGFHSRYTTS
jgi:excinuclease UvrABC nuclease subunit